MSVTAPIHDDVCKDGHVDRCVDVQIDAHKAVRKDERAAGGAFVIVLANHKGGVTKTTSTACLGAMFAEAGRRVLIVDCDPQANLSEAFGWVEELPGERLEDLLSGPDAADRYTPPRALQPDVATDVAWRDLLRIIPSTDALADVAADLPGVAGEGYENRLGAVLGPLRRQFDLVLLDTPPGRGNLSGMAVLAADGLLIPALAADLDVRGAGKLYDLRSLVRRVRVVGLEVCVVGVLAGAGATQAKQHLREGNWTEEKTKTEERQLHTQADGGMKAWEGRRGGWDEGLCRLGFGGGEMVR
jgi:chromosome partitioning protein